MKIYEQPKLQVKLHVVDIITTSVTFDDYDYYTRDPFSEVEIIEG